MTTDYKALAAAGVQTLQPYQPGKPEDELQRELGLTDIVKLASNENPLGPSDKALTAIAQASQNLGRYPDGSGYKLKSVLADMHNVASEQITLGNGSNDVLDLIARAFLGPGREAIFSEHAFAVYPIATAAVGATAKVAKAENHGHDLDAMAQLISDNTSVIFIANPNNPTGTWLSKGELKAFLKLVPSHVIVVLDEAYYEYVEQENYPNGLKLAKRYDNVIVTRTFSKIHGLAGLRIGYGISHPDVADLLNRVRQPFNCNSVALAAAQAAVQDDEHVQRSRELNAAGLNQVRKGLQSLNRPFIDSVANFVCVHVGDAAEVYQKLLQKGVITRPVAGYGMPEHLRVTIGLQAENQRFLDALEAVLNE